MIFILVVDISTTRLNRPRGQFSEKGQKGCIYCLFKVTSLATLNKQILSSLSTYDAFSLVITKPSFIWFGSTSVDICRALVHGCYRRGRLNFSVYVKF